MLLDDPLENEAFRPKTTLSEKESIYSGATAAASKVNDQIPEGNVTEAIFVIEEERGMALSEGKEKISQIVGSQHSPLSVEAHGRITFKLQENGDLISENL